MLNKQNKNSYQSEIISVDELVPKNHLVRKLKRALNLDFIYEEVKDLYSDIGRKSIDAVVLFKLNILQHTFVILSMKQTIKEVEVNVDYRWYLGYGFNEKVPHFGTFSKNYTRRFEDTDIFEKIFEKIVKQIIDSGFIKEENVFIDVYRWNLYKSECKYT